MLAAFALGAEGVQCGTRFLTVEECGVHEAWKEKVLKAKDSDTIVTGRGTGHPVRGLKNKFARECRKIEMAATPGKSWRACTPARSPGPWRETWKTARSWPGRWRRW